MASSNSVTAVVPRMVVADARSVVGHSSIIIEKGKIVAIDRADRYLDYKPEIVIKGDHLAAAPCFVNAHTHSSQKLLGGLGDGISLFDWLQKVVVPNSQAMEPNDAYHLARLFAMECMVSGVGAFNDMFGYYGSSQIMENIARAIAESGLRGILGRGLNEEIGDVTAGVQDTLRTADRWNGFEERLFFSICPALINTNSEDTLLMLKKTSRERKLRMHVHIAETIQEFRWAKENKSKTPVEYLDSIGFLDENTIAAHLVWLGSNDIGILKRSGTGCVLNTMSNARLGSGIAAIWNMIKGGLRLALGTDGSASSDNQDVLAVMRMAAFLPRAYKRNPATVTTRDVFEMATRGGYDVLGMDGGELKVGRPADITLFDLRHPSIFPVNDIVGQLVMASHPGVVRGIVVGGKLLYLDGKFRTLDQDDVLAKASEVWQRNKPVR